MSQPINLAWYKSLQPMEIGAVARPIPLSDVKKFIQRLKNSGFAQTTWSGGGRFVAGMK